MVLALILWIIFFITWWIESDHSGAGWTFLTVLYIIAIVIVAVKIITT